MPCLASAGVPQIVDDCAATPGRRGAGLNPPKDSDSFLMPASNRRASEVCGVHSGAARRPPPLLLAEPAESRIVVGVSTPRHGENS